MPLNSEMMVRLFYGGPVMKIVKLDFHENGLPNEWVLCVEATRQVEFGMYRAKHLRFSDHASDVSDWSEALHG